jgi:hypothetical protein
VTDDAARWTGSLVVCTSVITLLAVVFMDLIVPKDNEGGAGILSTLFLCAIPLQILLGIIAVGPWSYSLISDSNKTQRALSWLLSMVVIMAASLLFVLTVPLLLF